MPISSSGFVRILGVLLLSWGAALVCSAQGVPLVPGDIVTGECRGHESEPGCVLPSLFGPQGLTLKFDPNNPHFAHFIGSAQETLNQGVGTAIATQLAILPIISPTSGFTYRYDSAAGVFVRSTTSFGPIYTERAETIGRGKVSFGISYQRFRFGSLDGIDLRKIPAVFAHIPPSSGTALPFYADVIQTSSSLNLNMDQTMLYGTVGITNRLDVSVAIPIVSVRFGADSVANITRVSGPASGANNTPNPHLFDNGGFTNIYSQHGSASGIGDVTFRIKESVYQGENLRVAAALDIRAASGDARQFLGSGAVGIKPFLAISGGKRLSPHLNLGYQWNGDSILAGNITGTTVSPETATIQKGPATSSRLPGQFFYSLGADYGVTKRLTLDFDYLGQVLINAPRVFRSTSTTLNIPGGTGALTLPTVTAGKDTIGLNNGAVGFKYNFFNRLLFTGDLLFRMDNKGLRQNVTPLIALSYAFGS
jgi:hypothetical protein